MPRHKDSKNLTDKQKKDYNHKRMVVIKKMPRSYSGLLKKYYEQNDIEPIESHKVYAFMNKTTFNSELLNILSDFTENFLTSNQ